MPIEWSVLRGAAVVSRRPQRERATAYASGPFIKPGGHPNRTVPTQVEACAREGFRAFKPHGGFSPHEDGAIMLGLRASSARTRR